MNLLKISLALVILGITLLSLMSPTSSANVQLNDKIGHFIAYSVLMINLGLIIKPKHYLVAALSVIVYSCLMEFFQGFVPGRTVSLMDVVANSIGVGIGISVLLLFRQRILKIFRISVS